MLSDVTICVFEALSSVVLAFSCAKYLCFTLLFITVFTAWRLWTFKLSSLWNPEKPRVAPYWIPLIGHSLSFFLNSEKVIESGLYEKPSIHPLLFCTLTFPSNSLGRTREPFCIHVFGERLYIVTSPHDAAAVYNNVSSFSWDEYMSLLLKGFGVRGKALELSWHNPKPTDANYIPSTLNPRNMNLIHLTEDFYKKQLLPGNHLNNITAGYIDALNKLLQWDRISGPYVLFSDSGIKKISLKLFVRTVMTEAITRAVLGDLIFELEPDVVNQLMILNDYAWVLVFNYPKIFTPRLTAAVDRLSTAIRSYLKTPEAMRKGACWAIRSVIKSQEITGMDDDSRVAMLIMIWWAAHSNTVTSAFWLLSYILFDSSLTKAVRNETSTIFTGNALDTARLTNECPLLDSVWLEVLRLANRAMSVRKVVTRTTLSGKRLESGSTVLIPYWQLHSNEQVWGHTRLDFSPVRFQDNKKLRNHPSYRPFGGGVSFCPGRHLAKSEVTGFAATLLQRFDISLCTGQDGAPQRFPRLEETKPSTGITGPVDGMDVYFDMKRRVECLLD